MHPGLIIPLAGSLDELHSLIEANFALNRTPELGVGLSEQNERPWSSCGGSGSAHRREPLHEQGEALLCLPERNQRPALVHGRPAQPKRKTVLVRKRHHLLSVPSCLMR